VLDVFFDVILPVVLIAAVGGAVGRWRAIPVAPLSTVVFYLFSPALVFGSLANTELSAGLSFRIAGVTLLVFLLSYAASMLFSTLRRHDAPLRAGFALAVSSQNAGNMGLPVAFLAFGQQGLDIAVVNFVASASLAASAGVFIASMAGGSSREALLAPFRYPMMYAAVAGAAVNALNIDLPIALAAPIETLGDAAVPAMLVVLGLQLQQSVGVDDLPDTVAAVAIRLLIAPLFALVATTLLGVEGVAQRAMLVLSAMPTAVITIILATEFGAQPRFVTRVVVGSTLASVATLTLLITLVRT
jgi:hypothetical protein